MVLDPTNIQAAYSIGYRAARDSIPRAPAMSKDFGTFLADLGGAPVGEGIPLLEAFHRGYQARCDEEAAAILAGSP